jgi:hypothetical protein
VIGALWITGSLHPSGFTVVQVDPAVRGRCPVPTPSARAQRDLDWQCGLLDVDEFDSTLQVN